MTEVLIHLGYVALFVGTFLEGETVLLLAAVLAHRGYLNIYPVIGVATLGTILGDQLFYFLGRKRGTAFLARRPWWKSKTLRAEALIRRHQLLIILTFRFLYGLRNIIPFALGISGVKPRRFMPLSMGAAAVWATIIACIGYFLGEVAATILGKARHYEVVAAGVVVVGAAIVWALYFTRSRQRRT